MTSTRKIDEPRLAYGTEADRLNDRNTDSGNLTVSNQKVTVEALSTDHEIGGNPLLLPGSAPHNAADRPPPSLQNRVRVGDLDLKAEDSRTWRNRLALFFLPLAEAAAGFVGGAMAGAGIGTAFGGTATIWTGPGALVGASLGALIGVGLGAGIGALAGVSAGIEHAEWASASPQKYHLLKALYALSKKRRGFSTQEKENLDAVPDEHWRKLLRVSSLKIPVRSARARLGQVKGGEDRQRIRQALVLHVARNGLAGADALEQALELKRTLIAAANREPTATDPDPLGTAIEQIGTGASIGDVDQAGTAQAPIGNVHRTPTSPAPIGDDEARTDRTSTADVDQAGTAEDLDDVDRGEPAPDLHAEIARAERAIASGSWQKIARALRAPIEHAGDMSGAKLSDKEVDAIGLCRAVAIVRDLDRKQVITELDRQKLNQALLPGSSDPLESLVGKTFKARDRDLVIDLIGHRFLGSSHNLSLDRLETAADAALATTAPAIVQALRARHPGPPQAGLGDAQPEDDPVATGTAAPPRQAVGSDGDEKQALDLVGSPHGADDVDDPASPPAPDDMPEEAGGATSLHGTDAFSEVEVQNVLDKLGLKLTDLPENFEQKMEVIAGPEFAHMRLFQIETAIVGLAAKRARATRHAARDRRVTAAIAASRSPEKRLQIKNIVGNYAPENPFEGSLKPVLRGVAEGPIAMISPEYDHSWLEGAQAAWNIDATMTAILGGKDDAQIRQAVVKVPQTVRQLLQGLAKQDPKLAREVAVGCLLQPLREQMSPNQVGWRGRGDDTDDDDDAYTERDRANKNLNANRELLNHVFGTSRHHGDDPAPEVQAATQAWTEPANRFLDLVIGQS